MDAKFQTTQAHKWSVAHMKPIRQMQECDLKNRSPKSAFPLCLINEN